MDVSAIKCSEGGIPPIQAIYSEATGYSTGFHDQQSSQQWNLECIPQVVLNPSVSLASYQNCLTLHLDPLPENFHPWARKPLCLCPKESGSTYRRAVRLVWKIEGPSFSSSSNESSYSCSRWILSPIAFPSEELTLSLPLQKEPCFASEAVF